MPQAKDKSDKSCSINGLGFQITFLLPVFVTTPLLLLIVGPVQGWWYAAWPLLVFFYASVMVFLGGCAVYLAYCVGGRVTSQVTRIKRPKVIAPRKKYFRLKSVSDSRLCAFKRVGSLMAGEPKRTCWFASFIPVSWARRFWARTEESERTAKKTANRTAAAKRSLRVLRRGSCIW